MLKHYQEGMSFGGEKGVNMMMRQDVAPLCQDCIILDGDMWLEYQDGTKADTGKGVYNHHMTVSPRLGSIDPTDPVRSLLAD
jgi:hypothetical protein